MVGEEYPDLKLIEETEKIDESRRAHSRPISGMRTAVSFPSGSDRQDAAAAAVGDSPRLRLRCHDWFSRQGITGTKS